MWKCSNVLGRRAPRRPVSVELQGDRLGRRSCPRHQGVEIRSACCRSRTSTRRRSLSRRRWRVIGARLRPAFWPSEGCWSSATGSKSTGPSVRRATAARASDRARRVDAGWRRADPRAPPAERCDCACLTASSARRSPLPLTGYRDAERSKSAPANQRRRQAKSGRHGNQADYSSKYVRSTQKLKFNRRGLSSPSRGAKCSSWLRRDRIGARNGRARLRGRASWR